MTKIINLFCLPYAGGHKYSYREYQDLAPGNLNIVPLEYPGRVGRIQESPISDIELLVDDVYKQVEGQLEQGFYGIYGHSMGGLLAFLLTKKILENRKPLPLHIFITGTSGPSAISRFSKMRHLLPKDKFILEMKDLGGMPDAILENEDLLSYFEPILRADFQACETYTYERSEPFNIPMTVITGTEEDMTLEDIELWQNESSQKVDFIRMPGKHFFILEHAEEILKIITEKLK